jgi:hypothetical protein
VTYFRSLYVSVYIKKPIKKLMIVTNQDSAERENERERVQSTKRLCMVFSFSARKMIFHVAGMSRSSLRTIKPSVS